MDADTSPFVRLREQDDYTTPEATLLGVRHQMHHLRTHGEYLIPRSRLLSRDVQRAVGSVISGMGHTFLLFLLLFLAIVAATHLMLNIVDPNLAVLAPGGALQIPNAAELGKIEYVEAVLRAWYQQRIAPPLHDIFVPPEGYWPLLVTSAFAGLIWVLAWFFYATARVKRLEKAKRPEPSTRAGWTREDQEESSFVATFNVSSLLAGTIGVFAIGWYFAVRQPSGRFIVVLSLPLWFSLGGIVIGQFATFFAETLFARWSWGPKRKSFESRLRRSLYGAIRGACLYGVVAAVVSPVFLVILFSLSTLPLKFFVSLAGLAWAYWQARGGAKGEQLRRWIKRPLASLGLGLFLAFGFAELSARLLVLYRSAGFDVLALDAATTVGLALLAFVGLGVLIDANRVSPHYFYRDRLTEAYLKTDARVTRGDKTARQGMPLMTLRDDENLKLSDLGKDNNRGPYHLIVTALNLRGSNELTRKTFLSEHFIFGRDYIGSTVTGWTKTRAYRSDTTRLARAMTISAAAVGSAMGYQSFWAQAFVTTLFNVRLGYWMENPWFYRPGSHRRSVRGLTFWPLYLLREIFGWMSAQTSLVNLSDGGHTGDNLGLLPLLRRRCKTIVVSDAEADGALAFESFNNAVRMAQIEENIEIEIDLSPIMTRKEMPSGVMMSDASVVTGTIHYPEKDGKEAFEGRLVYLKSSISGPDIPAHVVNYAKENGAFPHESTADQFFNDAQFEAYRALGKHVGSIAARRLEDLDRFAPAT